MPAPRRKTALACPCNAPSTPPLLKKTDAPVKRADPDPPRRADRPKRVRVPDDDIVVVRRPPPREVYEQSPGPSIGVGVGIGIGGGGYGGGYGGQGRGRGGY